MASLRQTSRSVLTLKEHLNQKLKPGSPLAKIRDTWVLMFLMSCPLLKISFSRKTTGFLESFGKSEDLENLGPHFQMAAVEEQLPSWRAHVLHRSLPSPLGWLPALSHLLGHLSLQPHLEIEFASQKKEDVLCKEVDRTSLT